MRNIFDRLYRLRGWFSPLLDGPGWFEEKLAPLDIIDLVLDATEEQDTASFDVSISRDLIDVEFDAMEGQDQALFIVEVIDAVIFVDLDATEGQDEVLFDVQIIADGVVLVELDATEGQDTALFIIENGEAQVTNRGLGGFLGGTRGYVLVELNATEGQDTAHFDIEVLEALPVPPAPPLVPASLPEPHVFLPIELSTREVPLPVVAVLANLFAQEGADGMTAEADVTDWIAYDNEALMTLVRTQ